MGLRSRAEMKFLLIGHGVLHGDIQLRIHRITLTTAMLAAVVVTNWSCSLATADEVPPRIAWYGTLESGLTAAKRTGHPILLVSGAPHCHGVSGIW